MSIRLSGFVRRTKAVMLDQHADGQNGETRRGSISNGMPVLMAMLALPGNLCEKWVRLVLPLFLMLLAERAIFPILAVAIGYS